jgi:sugar lactone lactonase YvrE
MEPTLILSAKAALGEGPLWIEQEQRLYWIDIEGKRLHRFDPVASNDESFPLETLTGCIVPCRSGHFLIAAQSGIEEIRIANGKVEILSMHAHPEQLKPENRYNDGKCSPEGRFWFGSMSLKHIANQGSLFVLDSAGCQAVVTGATTSNGIGWSIDSSTFYWIDTPTRRVEAFDYSAKTGSLSNRRTAVRFDDDPAWGSPDGMTVDAAGMIWVAHWGGKRVTRWNPTSGELLQTVALPVSNVTSLTFGGQKLDTLFVTTARRSDEPASGGLWSFKPETPGRVADRFSGGEPAVK